jgi:hypothetical protein
MVTFMSLKSAVENCGKVLGLEVDRMEPSTYRRVMGRGVKAQGHENAFAGT